MDTETVDIAADELRLAQLACTKLATFVQGALSCGLPLLVMGAGDARGFLANRFRDLEAYAQVLHTIYGKQDAISYTLRLREASRAILANVEDLHHRLFAYFDSPDPSLDALAPARASISNLCDAIAEYGRLVLLDGALIAKVKEVSLQVFAALPTLTPPQVSSAR